MKREYPYKSLSMLMASLSVLENFELEKQIFVSANRNMADPFAAHFKVDIEKVLKEYFGINSKEQLKNATRVVNRLQVQAKYDLSLVKTQVRRGFRKNKARIDYLNEKLGYKSHWAKACRKSQTEMISLLLTFSNNLNDEIREEMVKVGVSNARLLSITALTKQLHKANINQETLKGTSKIETAKATEVLNEVYEQAMDICHLGQRLFKNEKQKKALFVFSQLIKKQGASTAVKSDNNKSKAA